MKFNPLSTLMAFYWGSVGVFCGHMLFVNYEVLPAPSFVLVFSITVFLFYGAVRSLMRENPFTWKREHPFWLFMTKEERQNDR